jgi:hypothetical protein
MHLLFKCSDQLDWTRLVTRFDSHWQVLLSHLILFGYIYPFGRQRIPHYVLQQLLARLDNEWTGPTAANQACQGPLLSPDSVSLRHRKNGIQRCAASTRQQDVTRGDYRLDRCRR